MKYTFFIWSIFFSILCCSSPTKPNKVNNNIQFKAGNTWIYSFYTESYQILGVPPGLFISQKNTTYRILADNTNADTVFFTLMVKDSDTASSDTVITDTFDCIYLNDTIIGSNRNKLSQNQSSFSVLRVPLFLDSVGYYNNDAKPCIYAGKDNLPNGSIQQETFFLKHIGLLSYRYTAGNAMANGEQKTNLIRFNDMVIQQSNIILNP